ncbi:MAG: fluoride efflux transporter CrcB [Paramuribaculum sp.]|nr:fluoride efflux transporter CrcB [Paramuribaculum sp.]
MLKLMFLAGCGGFVGTCGRFLLSRWCASLWHGAFPLGTFAVNMAGCFVIGLLFGLLQRTHVITPVENALLFTGFCGGFTTFSTFANDIWTLGNKGEWFLSLAYIFATVICGILLTWAGRALTK